MCTPEGPLSIGRPITLPGAVRARSRAEIGRYDTCTVVLGRCRTWFTRVNGSSVPVAVEPGAQALKLECLSAEDHVGSASPDMLARARPPARIELPPTADGSLKFRTVTPSRPNERTATAASGARRGCRRTGTTGRSRPPYGERTAIAPTREKSKRVGAANRLSRRSSGVPEVRTTLVPVDQVEQPRHLPVLHEHALRLAPSSPTCRSRRRGPRARPPPPRRPARPRSGTRPPASRQTTRPP